MQLKKQPSYEVRLTESINLLFVDGWHDYKNVARDFTHFKGQVITGACVVP